jgi:ATP-dependent Clp protease ATP-binding subunit ClpA
MRERWNDACQAILLGAKNASIELENHFLGTEHVAIAMLRRPESRLERLLRAHDIKPAEFLDTLLEVCTPGPLPKADHIPLTPRIRRVVRTADDLSKAVNEGGPIEEEHLLGAMIAGGRGVFVRLLEEYGLQPEQLIGELAAGLPPREAAEAPAATVKAKKPAPAPRFKEKTEPATVKRSPPSPARPIPLLPLSGKNPALLDWGVVKKPTSSSGAKKTAGARGGDDLLERLGRDLTRAAREGTLPEILGREAEIDQLQQALCRASRNNPLLVGEPGVGKTAIVEGLALRVARGNVPGPLREVRIIEMPMAALTAETRFRGDLEERLLHLVEDVKKRDVILVIDDAESLASHGSAMPDAGTVLRPFLARGEIRLIGTTSPTAFTKTFERDNALLRCFHPIKVAPPDPATVALILEGVRTRFEDFHHVTIPDPTLATVIRQAGAYLKQRHMPDAAIDLLDEACVKAASRPPEPLEAFRSAEMAPARVEPAHVAAVVSLRTGIPVETLTREEKSRIASMEDELKTQVIGQDDAVRRVAERIRMFKAGFREERRPLGVFLFLGPTGVGKTELAKAISRFLFNSEDHLYRLDMSEYSEPHEVARLIGPPPGYVGYGEEGQLTLSVRRDPHSVVLLDEIEKAHPKVFDLFLQVFDEGRLTDGKGVTTDFTHAIIVLTSNLGADLWKAEKRIGFRQDSARARARLRDTAEAGSMAPEEDDERRKRIFETLKKTFRLEFLNRLDDVILFKPLEQAVIRAIARQMVGRWQERSAEQGHPFEIDDEVLDFLCKKGYEPDLGARPMKRAIEQHLVAPLSRLVLAHSQADGEGLRAVVKKGRIAFLRG